MRVRGRHQHLIGRDAGRLPGHLLGLVDQVARHQEGIHNDDRQAGSPVVEHQGTGVKRIVHAARGTLQEGAANDHGELLGRDVQRARPRTKDLLGRCRVVGELA